MEKLVQGILGSEKVNILLIEDNRDHAFLIKRTMEQIPACHLVICERGDEALSELEKNGRCYQLVLSDYNLPGKNGIEILNYMKQASMDLPFVMLTGAGDEKVAVSTMKNGAYNYLVKDENYLRILPHIAEEALLKFRTDTQKYRYEREIKQKNAVLEQMNVELKKLDELKSEFIASVSHEFRTPLNSVRESICLIEDGVVNPSEDRGKRVLEIAKHNLERLTVLINDLLDFSRIEAGRLRLDKKEEEIATLLAESCETMREAARKKKLDLVLEPLERLPKVLVDRVRIVQVICNLIDNSIKYTQPGGSIKARASVESGGAYLKVTVQDSGIGIEKENLPRIFQKFQQIRRNEPGIESRGAGLGLAICKQIIELHDGAIGVFSEPGKGSQFFFVLPLWQM